MGNIDSLTKRRWIGWSVLAALQMMAGMGCLAAEASPETRAAEIAQKLSDPQGGVVVVAHRGCHNPSRALPSAPENSLEALDHCVTLGVDMMETDVRRTKDGALVMIHDARVDRTTNGTGRVADLTLAEIKGLWLRRNEGGRMSPALTGQTVPTLDEMLAAAKGRITLNLDIKEAIYPEVIAAAVKAGVADQVLVKTVVSADQPALSDQAPYSAVPFMPIVAPAEGDPAADLGALAARQTSGQRRVPAIEMVFLDDAQYAAVRDAARKTDTRLWANTLSEHGIVSIVSIGGDIEALRDQGQNWGRLIDAGISVFQTDEPALLLDYLKEAKGKR